MNNEFKQLEANMLMSEERQIRICKRCHEPLTIKAFHIVYETCKRNGKKYVYRRKVCRQCFSKQIMNSKSYRNRVMTNKTTNKKQTISEKESRLNALKSAYYNDKMKRSERKVCNRFTVIDHIIA